MLKKTLLICVVLFLFANTGCSGNIKVSGRVTFTDGEPVNFGTVCFETEKNTYTGRLDDNGNYSVGDRKDGAGIPAGEYVVWLSGTMLVEEGEKKGEDNYEIIETERVHPKYTLPDAKTLKFEVKKGGNNKFDFKVERP
ncbi:MAG: carboxypeptidase-like regulatory domain-containing protein [Planctomycetaceae bacterium]|nr:carboxypeptidase-like regulatory domain-containing protein [Planctomycetaceae bacterium]